jgi:hypothetical protein
MTFQKMEEKQEDKCGKCKEKQYWQSAEWRNSSLTMTNGSRPLKAPLERSQQGPKTSGPCRRTTTLVSNRSTQLFMPYTTQTNPQKGKKRLTERLDLPNLPQNAPSPKIRGTLAQRLNLPGSH